MLSSLPNLAPRDSHTLWYTSNHRASTPPPNQESLNHPFDHLVPINGSHQSGGIHSQRRPLLGVAQRSPLARLRADELYMERRKQNVQNYGSSWIKPPGIHKSLHQIREERRELEEHQEALRREQLAQELAEAEGAEELLQGEGADGEMEDVRDLDDDIPDAEVTGLDADESEPEERDDTQVDVPRGILAQRLTEDAYREALVRGEEGLERGFGEDEELADDTTHHSQMLQEEDLVHEHQQPGTQEFGFGMDMDADLDDDIPEAEGGGYEHTDTEAELSSSDDESLEGGQLPSTRGLNVSMVRSDGTQNSLDLSSMNILSGSSILGSSPRPRGEGRGR